MENDARGPMLIYILEKRIENVSTFKKYFGHFFQQKFANNKCNGQRIEKHFAYN